MKRHNEIIPDQYTLLKGKENYVVDLPDGDHDITVKWFADAPVFVWFNFKGARSMPLMDGLKGSQTLRARSVESVELVTRKTATVYCAVSYRELSRTDKLDFTPAEIAPPPPLQLQLSSAMDEAIRQQLLAHGIISPTIEVDDDDNLEDEDDTDEFGGGYMETDDEPGIDGADEGAAPGNVPLPDPSSADDAGDTGDDAGGVPGSPAGSSKSSGNVKNKS